MSLREDAIRAAPGHSQPSPRRARIGLLGGSFDPVHSAHIALALAALRQLNLDQVQLLPAAAPWQKGSLGATSQQRLSMLALAVSGHSRISVNPVEIERGGMTYTFDTVSRLPDTADYIWILGSDQLQNFCTWDRWEDILQHVTLAVAERPDAPLAMPAQLKAALDANGATLLHIHFNPMPVSATDIRHRIASGLPVDDRLAPAVAGYIADNRLYSSAPD